MLGPISELQAEPVRELTACDLRSQAEPSQATTSAPVTSKVLYVMVRQFICIGVGREGESLRLSGLSTSMRSFWACSVGNSYY